MENSTGTDFFTKRVVLLKKSDCERRDGKIFMPTTIDMAKIKKPNTGQYSKVRFSKSMPEEMVRQTLQEAFPSFNLTGRFHCASYGQGSTTFIFHGNPGVWNGKMIKKTVRGNSVLYILLEDDQMPQESPHVTKDAFNSSAPVPLPNLNQPILSDSSATAMVQNTMQPPNDSPMQEFNIPLRPSAASTNCNLIKPQNMADSVALHRLNQPTFTSTDTSATIMTQHNMQPCSYFQVQGSSIPPGPSATSTNFNVKNPQEITTTVAFPNINQPSLSDSSAAVMVQNNMQPWNAFQMQECSIPSESSEILASNPNFSTPELRNAAPADGGLDFTTMVDRWLETPGFFDHIMTDDSDHTGTSEISNLQPPNQGFFFNSPEISDSSADNNNTTSGISELGHNLSSDDLSPHEEEQFEFSVTPERVPLQGGNLCRFQSKRPLPRNVQSASAIFEHLDTVNIKRCGDDCLDGDKIPPSNTPGEVNIFLKRADGEVLGETKIWYYDQDKEALQRIIENPQLQADFFRNYSVMLTNRNTATASGPEAQNSGIFGSTEPVQMLCVLVYAAAEIGGEQFIKMIFNLSAGRIIYDLYKDNSALPEAIAREYGHEKIATYLEGITGRYSKESNDAPNYPQTIDWSELVRAAEEAQKQPSFSSEEKSNQLESNGTKDTGYFGDIDTSSNESCESVSSESEDNIALASSKEMDYLVDELSGITLVPKYQEFGIKKAAAGQNLTSFRNTGLFNRCRGNSTVSNKQGRRLPLFRKEKEELRLIAAHSPFKTFHGVSNGIPEPQTVVNFKAPSICQTFYKQISRKQKTGVDDGEARSLSLGGDLRKRLGLADSTSIALNLTVDKDDEHLNGDLGKSLVESLAKRKSLPAFTSTINRKHEYHGEDWGKSLGEGLAKRKSLPAFTPTINRKHEYRSEDCGKSLGEGLAKRNSLPAFRPTINRIHEYHGKDWGKSLGEGLAKSTSLTVFIPTINCEHGYLHEDWGKGLGERLRRTKSLTAFTLTVNSKDRYLIGEREEGLREGLVGTRSLNTFSLTINIEDRYLDEDWGKDLGEDLAKSAFLTTFDMTVNTKDGYLNRDCAKGLGEGLAKSASLTAFTLTVNSKDGYLVGDWGKGLGEGLAKSASLTAFTLTVNNKDRYLNGDWGKGLGEGLAKSASLTAFTLTVNSEDGYLDGDWGKGLGEGLARGASLTAFNLTVSNKHGYLYGDWGKRLGEGLAMSGSLTVFTLTVDNKHGYLDGDWGKGLAEGLAKGASLIAFILIVNSKQGYLDRDWVKGLGEGLAKITSLTAFTITVNIKHGYLYGDWEKGLGEGLAKSASLAVFTLTVNSEDRYLDGDWGKSLGESLAKSVSLTAFTLTVNSRDGYLKGDWGKGLGEGLAKSASLTTFNLTVNTKDRYLVGDWGKGLGEGLAKSTSLTVFTLTVNNNSTRLVGDWGKGLDENLAKSASLTAFNLTVNTKDRYMVGNWGKGLGKSLAKSASLTAFILKVNSED